MEQGTEPEKAKAEPEKARERSKLWKRYRGDSASINSTTCT